MICSLLLTSLISQDDALSYSLPIVDFVSDLSIHLQGFWHDQLLEAPQEGITNLHDVVFIRRWFGSYTQYHYTQNTRYVDRRYWLDQVSQSSED